MMRKSARATTRDAAGRRDSRRTRWIGGSLGLAASILLAGCASTANAPQIRANELDDAGGRPCPQKLPIGDDPTGHGFGVEKPASEYPDLLEPQEAWVCTYGAFDVGTSSNGGAMFEWRRVDEPVPVAPADLPDLQAALDQLAPADRSGGCTADLGPRWMVVYSHDGDLTGVVVDDYGCHDVRLTDNPHITPPGADGQEGTVGGVLDGGRAILDALNIGRLN